VSKIESTPTIPQSSKGKGKERVVEQSPKTIDLPKPTVPLTISSVRKLISKHKSTKETNAQDQSIEIENIHNSPGEGERNVKKDQQTIKRRT